MFICVYICLYNAHSNIIKTTATVITCFYSAKSFVTSEVHKSDVVSSKRNARRWHVTISCQPDGCPPQPVRPWKSGRVHLADGSNVVVLELP